MTNPIDDKALMIYCEKMAEMIHMNVSEITNTLFYLNKLVNHLREQLLEERTKNNVLHQP